MTMNAVRINEIQWKFSNLCHMNKKKPKSNMEIHARLTYTSKAPFENTK